MVFNCASAEVVLNARPSDEKYEADVVENDVSTVGTQVPFIARQPAARLIPPANVEVPVPWTARNPVVVAPPLTMRPVVCEPPPIVELAAAIIPLNCDAFMVSYATNEGAVVVPPTSSIVFGFVVPMPTLPLEFTRMRSEFPDKKMSGAFATGGAGRKSRRHQSHPIHGSVDCRGRI